MFSLFTANSPPGVAYTVSKHGTVGLTKSTAAFYGPRGIRCLAILPGPMMTNMVNEGHAARYHPEGLAMGECQTRPSSLSPSLT